MDSSTKPGLGRWRWYDIRASMTPMRFLLVGVLLFGLAATTTCSAPRSARCKKVCKREAACAETPGMTYKVDESECVMACTALDRDEERRELVSAHITCVDKAANCEAVAACRTR